MTRRVGFSAEGVNAAPPLEDSDTEMICCPELDSSGYGNHNLKKSACETRQDDPKMPMCYQGCKGRRPAVKDPLTGGYFRALTSDKERRWATIRKMFKEGKTIPAIAKKIDCAENYVRRYLRIWNMIPTRRKVKVNPNSLRQRVFAHLEQNPDATTNEIMETFSCHRSKASEYRLQYFNLRSYRDEEG